MRGTDSDVVSFEALNWLGDSAQTHHAATLKSSFKVLQEFKCSTWA